MLVRSVLMAVLTMGLLAHGGLIWAEDAAPDVMLEWKGLVKDLATFKETMKSIKLRYSKATAAEKSKLAKEANSLNTTFQTKTYPRMKVLAAQVYKKNPEDTVAAEVLLLSLYARNQFSEIVKVAAGVLKKDPKAELASNYSGIAKFAMHDFEGAIQTLKAAEAEGVLTPELGGQYLDLAEQYIEFWKAEQAIRAKEDAATGDDQLPIVKFTTSKGDIELLMFENEAPNTVANFISLVEKKYYDGIKFHRVEPIFMVQGGCPDSKKSVSRAGTGGPGYNIPCECYEPHARRHFAGSLSMAHAGKDTGGSQFFLTHLPTNHLNPEPGKTQGVHTVFGRAIKGLDVIQSLEVGDEILSAVVLRKRNHEYVPKTLPATK